MGARPSCGGCRGNLYDRPRALAAVLPGPPHGLLAAARDVHQAVGHDHARPRSGDQALDNVLKGEAYFYVERFPTLTFRSNDVRFDGDRVVEVVGDLTLLGVTKPLTLKVDDFVCGQDPFFKRPLCGAEVSATIKRSDWGMTRGLPLAPADEVKIAIPVEAYRH